MGDSTASGHAAAAVTIVIWGLTYVSTKLLLEDFEPVEILFARFLIGYAALLVACPHVIRETTLRQELTFAGAGLSGMCLYYLLENVALTYTLASNVGMIAAVTPFFVAIAMRLLMPGEERLGANFFAGFAVAMAGIFVLSFNGSQLELNPLGDALALLAAVAWAVYSVLLKRIDSFGFGSIQSTRRMFFYGLLFMLPCLFLLDNGWNYAAFLEADNLANILFLGLGACALCFVSWQHATHVLGAIRTSAYIYLIPVITVAGSVVILGEPLTALSVLGMALAFLGLALSEDRFIGWIKDKARPR